MSDDTRALALRRQAACCQCTPKCELFLSGRLEFDSGTSRCARNRWPMQRIRDADNVLSESRAALRAQIIQSENTAFSLWKLFSPGDFLGILIFKISGQLPSNCSCNERKAQMNGWGWWGSWKNRKKIAMWLMEEARKRGMMASEDSVKALIHVGFKEFLSQRKQYNGKT